MAYASFVELKGGIVLFINNNEAGTIRSVALAETICRKLNEGGEMALDKMRNWPHRSVGPIVDDEGAFVVKFDEDGIGRPLFKILTGEGGMVDRSVAQDIAQQLNEAGG